MLERKEQGNTNFKARKFRKAVEYYTKAWKHANMFWDHVGPAIVSRMETMFWDPFKVGYDTSEHGGDVMISCYDLAKSNLYSRGFP